MNGWQCWKLDLQNFVHNYLQSNYPNLDIFINIQASLMKHWLVTIEFLSKQNSETRAHVSSDCMDELCSVLPKVSMTWRYQITSAQLKYGKIYATMHALGATIGTIQSLQKLHENISARVSISLLLDPAHAQNSSLTSHRLRLVYSATYRLLAIVGYNVSCADALAQDSDNGVGNNTQRGVNTSTVGAIRGPSADLSPGGNDLSRGDGNTGNMDTLTIDHDDVVDGVRNLNCGVERTLEGQQCVKNIPVESSGYDVKESNIDIQVACKGNEEKCCAISFPRRSSIEASVITVTNNSKFRVMPAAREVRATRPVENAAIDSVKSDERKTVGAQVDSQFHPVNLMVAAVLNSHTGRKEIQTSATEYISGRRTVILEAWRCRQPSTPPDAEVEAVAEAAVAHELLSVSAMSPCKIATGEDVALSSSAERALFALYNCARITTVLERFAADVATGAYPPLPTVAQLGAEFDKLASEDECTLLWNFLLPLPSLLDDWARDILRGKCSIHRICSYVSGLSGAFSRYYSRTKILIPPRQHLISTVHVRVHLLRSVQCALQHCFQVLGYRPPARM